MISLLVIQKLLRTLFLLGFVRHGTNYLSASGNLTPYQSFTRNCLIIVMISSVLIFIGRNWLIITFMISSVPIFIGRNWLIIIFMISSVPIFYWKKLVNNYFYDNFSANFFILFILFLSRVWRFFFCKFDLFNVINLEFVLK